MLPVLHANVHAELQKFIIIYLSDYAISPYQITSVEVNQSLNYSSLETQGWLVGRTQSKPRMLNIKNSICYTKSCFRLYPFLNKKILIQFKNGEMCKQQRLEYCIITSWIVQEVSKGQGWMKSTVLVILNHLKHILIK